MMEGRHAGLLVLSHIVALGIGSWIGVEIVNRVSHFRDLEHLGNSQKHASVQFAEASTDTAREALTQHLDLLNRLGPSTLPGTELALDKMLTVVRLWRVEIASDRYEQAAAYHVEAQHLCEAAKWRDCSDEEMVRLLNRR